MSKASLLILIQNVFVFTLLAQDFEIVMEDVAFKSTLDGSEQRYIQIKPNDFNIKNEYDLIIGLHGHGSDRWQFAKSDCPEC